MAGLRLPPALEALVDAPSSDDEGDGRRAGAAAYGRAASPSWAPLASAAPPPPPIDSEIVAPSLSDDAALAFAALRGALATGERSPRVLALTAHLLTAVNAADYSAWQVRWECVRACGGSAADEAAFVDALAAGGGAGAGGLKVYQLWRYRARLAMEGLDCDGRGGTQRPVIAPATLARERAFADGALSGDAKHYHAWAHRAALAAAAGPASWWPEEGAVAAAAMVDDPRNNSAWAHRAAAVGAGVRGGLVEAGTAAGAEFALAAAAVRADPANESAWAHVRVAADLAGGLALACDPRYAGLAAEVLASQHQAGCVPALALLHEAHAARVVAARGVASGAAVSREAAAECRRRLTAADPGRAGLWEALGRGL